MLEPQPSRAFRHRRAVTVCVLAGALTAGGCVTRADYERLRRDQQEMRAQVADLQVSVDALTRRIDTMKSSQTESRAARDAEARVRELERRLAEMEARPTPVGPVGMPGEVVPTPTALPRVPGSEAAQIAMRRDLAASAGAPLAYQRALQLYRDGQADQAIQAFREFLRGNAKSALADNAQYWIGEAYFAQGDYNRSVIELNEVLLKYPTGDQVPAALLALATAFSTSGDKIDAKLVLQKLITDHPQSEEATVARQQLQSLTD